jgi:hypothetical protein
MARFWPFAALLILFTSIVGHWSSILPYNQGPDEELHYGSNVEFILNHHRLPVSGVDDLDIFRQCFDSQTGRQTCRNSYNMFPALNYVVAAAFARAGESFGLKPLTGARIASITWGMIFVVALEFLFLEVLGSIPLAAAFAGLIALIPQLMFTCTYVNADAHSLAISALLGLTAVRFYKKQDRRRILEFSAATGLLFSTKYNYFLYAPFIALFIGWLALRKKLDRKGLLLTISSCATLSLLISGFWFFRNAYLYHDPMGLKFASAMMDRFHVPGVSRPLDLKGAWFLHEHDFYWHTLLSMIGDFKHRTLHFPAGVYFGYYCIFTVGAAGILHSIIRYGDRELHLAAAATSCLVAICYLQHMYNSLAVDFQPQGRYLFPILVPLGILAAATSRKAPKQTLPFIFLLLANNLWFLAKSLALMQQV